MRSLRRFELFALVFLALAMSADVRAENWPQWRGPQGDGISNEVHVPVSWSKTENVAWRTKLPNKAGATPIVWDDRIFLTSAAEDNNTLLLMCFGTDGKERWKSVIGTGNRNVQNNEGNLASPTPSTDGKRVWAFVGTGMLGCWDVEGHEVWKFDVQDRYGKFNIQFGMASTPVLDGNRLYLQLIHGDGNPVTREAMVVCVDGNTGAEVWKQPRPSPASDENEHSYASPCIYRDGQRAFLLTHGADFIVAHDLNDGHELWRAGGLQPRNYDRTLRLVASPVVAPGLIIAPSAKKGNLLALRPGGSGDITNDANFKIWEHATTPDVPSPLIHGGLVYLFREIGALLVLDATTGQKQYEERVAGGNNNRGSAIYADGNIYLPGRDGTTTVVKTGRKFETVSVNALGESTTASPVISNGRLYLRTWDALWAIGKK